MICEKTKEPEISTVTIGGVDLYQQSVLVKSGSSYCNGCYLEGNIDCREITGINCTDSKGVHYIWVEDGALEGKNNSRGENENN